MTTYTPRHKGRVAPDSVRQGPERWIRAALNAARHPNSKAARLYQARTANAYRVASISLNDRAWERRDAVYVAFRTYDGHKRTYAMCSDFCAVMQVQLDFSTLDLATIKTVFDRGMTSELRGVVPFSGDRNVRCQVCATTIKPVREG